MAEKCRNCGHDHLTVLRGRDAAGIWLHRIICARCGNRRELPFDPPKEAKP